jgi:hypothetical protein
MTNSLVFDKEVNPYVLIPLKTVAEFDEIRVAAQGKSPQYPHIGAESPSSLSWEAIRDEQSTGALIGVDSG